MEDAPIVYGILKPGPNVPGGVPYVRPSEMGDRKIRLQEVLRTTSEIADQFRRSKLAAGDIILSIVGTIGKVAFVPPELHGGNITQCSVRIRPRLHRVDPRYLCWALESPSVRRQYDSLRFGSGVPRLNVSHVRALMIPLAPLSEQRRIADILDKADAVRRQRKEAIALTEELLRSAFLEMFGDPVTNPKGWPEQPFGALVRETQLGLVRAATEQSPDKQYPYIRMNAIRADGQLDLTNVTRVNVTPSELSIARLMPGDFLFNTRNSEELVGKSAVFHDAGTYVFNNNIMRVRFTSSVQSDYVWAYFQTARGVRELAARKSGTTSVFAIYYKSLATLPVLVSPRAEQDRYAALCERVRHLRADHLRHSDVSDALFRSLVERAFRGELARGVVSKATQLLMF
ncbi:restriction endonuclease subunit S [Sorangium sp. So ce136]|uniref:restriction endonuclease subunit S n=1 Tax=Sorangium sp. So ce136 TaxID=3133284 RepID=UPI003EFC0D81